MMLTPAGGRADAGVGAMAGEGGAAKQHLSPAGSVTTPTLRGVNHCPPSRVLGEMETNLRCLECAATFYTSDPFGMLGLGRPCQSCGGLGHKP